MVCFRLIKPLDFSMKDLTSNMNIVNTFKKWAQTDSVTHRPQLELAVTGTLCLGNFARSGKIRLSHHDTDETCCQLVQKYEVDKFMINLLYKEVAKLNKDHPLSSENLVRAIVSALKNITLADSCKEFIDANLLFQSIMGILAYPRSRQISCNCISTLKNLTTGKSGKVFKFLIFRFEKHI